jgi:integrase
MPDSSTLAPVHVSDSRRRPKEPDLEAILRLLDPANFPSRTRGGAAGPAWQPYRDVAIVALCWIVGLRPLNIEHLKRGDWMPGGETIVLAPGLGRYEGFRARALPVLERARDAVAGYLKAYPATLPPEGPLIRRPDERGFVEADVGSFNLRLRKVSNGSITTLATLSGKFMSYIENTRAKDGTVERLVGRTGVYDHLNPDMRDLRRAVERAHPASITNLRR